MSATESKTNGGSGVVIIVSASVGNHYICTDTALTCTYDGFRGVFM